MQALSYVLAFLLEIAMIIAYGYSGYQIISGHSALRWLTAIALPLIIIIVWSLFLSPKADYRLAMPWLLIAKIAIFTGGALLLAVTNRTNLAASLAIVSAIHLALATYWKQV